MCSVPPLLLANTTILASAYGLLCSAYLAYSQNPQQEIPGELVGLLSTLFLSLAVSGGGNAALWRQIILGMITFLYSCLALASFATKSSVSGVSLLYASKTTAPEDLLLLAEDYLSPNIVLIVCFGYLVLMALCLAAGIYLKGPKQSADRWKFSTIGTIGYICVLLSGFSNREPVSGVFEAVMHEPLRTLARQSRIQERTTPVTAHEGLDSTHGPAPHIFLVLMESLNPAFIGMTGPSGEPITPELNSIRTNSLWCEAFFGNGVYSFVGQLALLESMYPSVSVSPWRIYTGTDMVGLPSVLKRRGYESWFFTAHQNLYYNPPSIFLDKLGFDHLIPMSTSSTNLDASLYWGWGLQDDAFYAECFRLMFDSPRDKPVFAVLANISNHAPFLLPEHLRKFYPHPKNQKESYLDSVAFADACLAKFYYELSNRGLKDSSIIVITGDHGFPMGEHGNFLNVSRAFEENFRTICAIQWPGFVQPAVLKSACSQIDLAPTMLDLLQLSSPTCYRGRSLFDTAGHPNIALCAQPYDGGYLCAFTANHALRYSCQTRTLSFEELTGRGGDSQPSFGIRQQLTLRLANMAADLLETESN